MHLIYVPLTTLSYSTLHVCTCAGVMDFHPVILAGGRGSRMYPLTEECPKALLLVGNMPLVWYPIQLLERNGFKGIMKTLLITG